MSHIDADDRTALYIHANQWTDNGSSMYACAECTKEKKELFGCGYEEAYRGKGQLREAKGINCKGTCPGWWKNCDFVDDVTTMRVFKGNLGHPLHIPQRLLEGMRYLDNQEIIVQNKKMAELEKKK